MTTVQGHRGADYNMNPSRRSTLAGHTNNLVVPHNTLYRTGRRSSSPPGDAEELSIR